MAFGVGRLWTAHRRLAIVGLVVALLVATFGVVHAPFVRVRVLAWAVERLRTDARIHAQVDDLDYNLLTLRASVWRITLAADDQASPFLAADSVSVDLPWSIITGRIAIESVEIVHPTITITRDRDGQLNLPAGVASVEPAAPEPSDSLGPIDIGHLVVRDLGIGYVDQSADLSVEGRDLTLAAARTDGAPLAGRLSMSGGATLKLGGRKTSVSSLDGGLSFDGSSLAVDELTLRSPEGQVRLDGTVDLLSREPRADVRYAGSLDLGLLAQWLSIDPAPSGRLAFSGQLAGPLDRLDGTIDVGGDRLGWSTLRNVSIQLRAAVSGTVATVESFRAVLASGEVSGDARLPLDPTGTGRARIGWRGLDVGALAGAAAVDLGVRLASVADGTATLDWTGQEFMTGRGALDNRLRAASSSEGALAVEGRAELRLDGGNWRLSLDQRLGDAVLLSGEAGGRLDADDVAASTVSGRASVHVPLVDEALRYLGRPASRWTWRPCNGSEPTST